MAYCQNCGAKLDDGTWYCTSCGSPVASHSQNTININFEENTFSDSGNNTSDNAYSWQNTQTEEKSYYCKNCGAKLDGNETVCPYCGCVLSDSSKPNDKKFKRTVIILASVIAVLLAGILIMMLLKDEENPDPDGSKTEAVEVNETENESVSTPAAVSTPQPTVEPTPEPTPVPTVEPTPFVAVGSGVYNNGAELMSYDSAMVLFPGISSIIEIPMDIVLTDDFTVVIRHDIYKRMSWHIYDDGKEHNFGTTGHENETVQCYGYYWDVAGHNQYQYLVRLDDQYFWVADSLIVSKGS